MWHYLRQQYEQRQQVIRMSAAWMEPVLYGLLGKVGRGRLNRPYPATYVPRHEIAVQAWSFSLQAQMALDISGSIISVHRVLGRLQIGTFWADMCWNGGDCGDGNSLLAQDLRNQASLPRVSRWPESEPALQALDLRWDTYSSTSHRRPWEKTF